jgi:putative transposase
MPNHQARTDVELTAQIQAVHRESRGTYGAPRIHAELAAQGIRIGRKRVARLMRAAGLHGVSRRNQFLDDRSRCDCTAGAGSRRATVRRGGSRSAVGGEPSPTRRESHLRTKPVLAALNMAAAQRRPTDVVHHSDTAVNPKRQIILQ